MHRGRRRPPLQRHVILHEEFVWNVENKRPGNELTRSDRLKWTERDKDQEDYKKSVICERNWKHLTLLLPLGQFDPIQCLTLLLPLYLLIYFTRGVNLTPTIKTSGKLLELILFSKFKCEVLCLFVDYLNSPLNI